MFSILKYVLQGDLVYVNYGTKDDFKMLKDTYKVNCTGKIVIVRYGKIYRGAKVVFFSLVTNPYPALCIYNSVYTAPAQLWSVL